jgi:hypothetical protein
MEVALHSAAQQGGSMKKAAVTGKNRQKCM